MSTLHQEHYQIEESHPLRYFNTSTVMVTKPVTKPREQYCTAQVTFPSRVPQWSQAAPQLAMPQVEELSFLPLPLSLPPSPACRSTLRAGMRIALRVLQPIMRWMSTCT